MTLGCSSNAVNVATPLPSARAPATVLPSAAATLTPRAIPLGQPFKKESAPEVYLLDDNKKRVVRDPDAFGFIANAIWILADAQVEAMPSGAPITNLIKGGGVPVYLMKDGKKRRIPDLETLVKLGYQLDDISQISQDLFDFIPVGEDINR